MSHNLEQMKEVWQSAKTLFNASAKHWLERSHGLTRHFLMASIPVMANSILLLGNIKPDMVHTMNIMMAMSGLFAVQQSDSFETAVKNGHVAYAGGAASAVVGMTIAARPDLLSISTVFAACALSFVAAGCLSTVRLSPQKRRSVAGYIAGCLLSGGTAMVVGANLSSTQAQPDVQQSTETSMKPLR